MKFVKKYVGLMVMLVVVAILAFVSIASAASPAVLVLQSPVKGSVKVGDVWNVRWISANYPASTVSVNLIKKVSSNPNRYELVRTIAKSTKNDNVATWAVSPNDVGNGISLEIGCTVTDTACSAGESQTSKGLAVIRNSENYLTANALEALEALRNK